MYAPAMDEYAHALDFDPPSRLSSNAACRKLFDEGERGRAALHTKKRQSRKSQRYAGPDGGHSTIRPGACKRYFSELTEGLYRLRSTALSE